MRKNRRREVEKMRRWEEFELGSRNAEGGKKERRREDEKVGAACSRENDGNLAIDCNQEKVADDSEHKMDTILFSDFRIPTSHFQSFPLPTSNHSDFRILAPCSATKLVKA